jgi:hypothetical protein
MKKAEVMSFGKPDEVRKFPKGHIELIKIGGATVGRAVFEPGCKWSDSIQLIAKTKSCEAPHFQYHIAGVLMVWMTDSSKIVYNVGDSLKVRNIMNTIWDANQLAREM